MKYIAGFSIALTIALIGITASALVGWIVTQRWTIEADTEMLIIYIVVGSWCLLTVEWVISLIKRAGEAADNYEKKFGR